MQAEYKIMKHEVYDDFAAAGIEKPIALQAAIAIARLRVMGIVPNQQQLRAIGYCAMLVAGI